MLYLAHSIIYLHLILGAYGFFVILITEEEKFSEDMYLIDKIFAFAICSMLGFYLWYLIIKAEMEY